MNNMVVLPLSGLIGGALGAIFFGGLWWTVRKGVASPNPALWFCASLQLRMGFALTGFYFVARGGWQPLLMCLLGFMTARLAVNWLTREIRAGAIAEAGHAS